MRKILFWDFDGTLVHPNGAYSVCLDRALRIFGFEIPYTEIGRCTRLVPWHNSDTVYPQPTGELWWEALYSRYTVFTEAWGVPQQIHRELCLQYRRELTQYPYRLFDDARQTLEQCREMGYTNVLLSNNHPDLPLVLERMELTSCFEKKLLGSVYGYDKPCRELFDHAVRETGEADEYWMIGDNPDFDIRAGKEAGLNTVWMHRSGDSADWQRYADVILEKLSAIPPFLQKYS